MKEYAISSSFIAGICYDRYNETLVIRMKNNSLYYYNLPKGYFEILIDASRIASNKKPRYGHYEFRSPGEAYNAMIKGQPMEKIHGKRNTRRTVVPIEYGDYPESSRSLKDIDCKF
jgi:hypothetical protein